MEKQSGVQSLERTFSLVELLSHHPGGLHLMEIAAASGLHRSTAHRLLGALADMGYVRQDARSKYALTLKLYEVAGRVVEHTDVMEIAKKHLAALRDSVQEAVHLGIPDGADIVYIHKEDSNASAIRMFSRIGMRRPMYCTALGKSILATLPDDEVAAIWDQSNVKPYTPHTLVTLSALHQELGIIRQNGYAIDNEENELGIRCVAAAIRDYTGRCQGAVSVSAPLGRMPEERVQELAAALLQTAAVISAEAGYRS